MILILGSVSYSQNSESNRAELVSRCERAAEEVDASRKLIAGQEEKLKGYEDLIVKAEKLQLLSDDEIKLRKAETAELRIAIAKEREALGFKQREADELRRQLASEVKKKNFFKKLAKFSTVAAAVAIGILVLK